jgi:ABC-type multidrug transport system fused ATPase/permease subunit
MTMVILYLGKLNQLMYFFRRFKFSIDKFKDSLSKLDLFLSITQVNNARKKKITNFDKIKFENLSFSYPNFAKNELKFLTIIENRIKSYSRSLSDYEKDQLHLIEEAKKEAKQENPIILNDINLELEI